MNLSRLQHILKFPNEINPSDEEILNEAIEVYPYFQALYALKLKYLANTNSFRFNQFLRKTATRTTNRKVLFDFITSTEFKQQKTVDLINQNQQKLEELSELEKTLGLSKQEAETIENPNLFEKKNYLEFEKQDKHSFNEWLSYLKVEPITNKKDGNPKNIKTKFEDNEVAKQQEIINNFIKQNPKIKPEKSNRNLERKIELKSSPSEMMTETLANVYLEQKRYDKAIQAFNILILKNPEKSSLFANRINEIKQLKENNI
ncbi:hypothetical protein [Psychroflexus sp. ALD_RP9]|uniref:hypothetical protein n=1 Tax=Psychroflexus sp. ALD_RP9 TaxID=2777186 RepID=UPI001A8FC53E|nr:hypothetical protein [Psychroflexus sp. ALD_RP9]QSS97712.1 hypothetical protein IMZ30_03100 [Psychroflexus sp. ALD_RP9]